MGEIPNGWRVIEGGKVDGPEKPLRAISNHFLTSDAVTLLLEYCNAQHDELGVVGEIDMAWYESVKGRDLYRLYSQLYDIADENIMAVPQRLALMKAIAEHPIYASLVLKDDSFDFTPAPNTD